MPRAPRSIKLIATAVLAVAVTGGIAVAATSGGDVPAPETPHATPAIAAANTITESGYVPLAPCRIASTVNAGGAIRAGQSRSFFAGGGTGFLPQGGKNGGCGIPFGASAVAVSVTALHETNYGYLTLYSDGAARPAANQVSYVKNQGVTTLVNVPVDRVTGKFALFSSSQSDVTIDVAGYYREPIAVTVSSAGSIVSQSGQITGVSHTAASGTYYISFSENISSCAYSATTLGSNFNAAVSNNGSTGIIVYVRALDKSTTSTVYGDAVIYVTVTC